MAQSSLNSVGKGLGHGRVAGHAGGAQVQLVEEFRQVHMGVTDLGVHNQNATSRIALGLCRRVGAGEFPLAGARLVVAARVPSQ